MSEILPAKFSAKKITLIILCLLVLGGVGYGAYWFNKPPAPLRSESDPVINHQWDYEFGRAVTEGEETYAKFRADRMEAGKKMGLSPEAVGDGMDTWHWWVGVDNPGFWQDTAALTSSAHNYTGLKLDLLRIILKNPRGERFKTLGLISDPDTVKAEKPDQFGLMLDRMKDGSLSWNPDVF
ncbi:MAG: hypothetical protein EOP05_14600, partial [Proteobacteria bacterium]